MTLLMMLVRMALKSLAIVTSHRWLCTPALRLAFSKTSAYCYGRIVKAFWNRRDRLSKLVLSLEANHSAQCLYIFTTITRLRNRRPARNCSQSTNASRSKSQNPRYYQRRSCSSATCFPCSHITMPPKGTPASVPAHLSLSSALAT